MQIMRIPSMDNFKRLTHSTYKAMNFWLRNRSSDLVQSPLYVWKLLTDFLKSQGAIGSLMLVHVDKAISKLGINPEKVLPINHGLSKMQISAIKRRGQAGATEETYGMILTHLKYQALNGNLAMEIKTVAQMKMIQELGNEKSSGGGWSTVGKDKDKKKKKKAVNSVSTDFSTLTLNTLQTGKKEFVKYPLCPGCRLYHAKDKNGNCPFVKRESNGHMVFKILEYLKHRSVRQIGPDGKSTVSEYWIKKLFQYVFPSLGIVDEEMKKKIVRELREAATKLPKATTAEMESHAKNSQTYVSMASVQDNAHINLMKMESDMMVNAVAKMKADKKAKNYKVKRKKAREVAKDAAKEEEEDDSESESEEEDSQDSDNDD
jgi:hypothetical protein